MYFMEHMVTFKYMYPTCGDQIGAIAIFPLSHLCAEGAVTKEGINRKQKQRPRMLGEANSSTISLRREQRKEKSM